MIKGTYIFYQDGKEIYRSPNVITKFGSRFLTNLIAGNLTSAKMDMAFGIVDGSEFATSNTNTKLGFEFYRSPVLFGSTDIQTSTTGNPPVSTTTYYVVYKSTIPQDIVGKINEIGLYPSVRSSINNYDDKFITDFSDYLSWSTSTGVNPDIDTTNYRIGGNLLTMTASAGTPKEYKTNTLPIDISGYSVNDTLKLAYYKADANLASIKIRLYSESTKYYEYTLTAASGTGYKISPDIPLSDVFSSPTNSATLPDKTNINQIGIIITASSGTTNVGLDGLRINDEDRFDPTFGLLSRSTLASTLNKTAGLPVDVEYKLKLEF